MPWRARSPDPKRVGWGEERTASPTARPAMRFVPDTGGEFTNSLKKSRYYFFQRVTGLSWHFSTSVRVLTASYALEPGSPIKGFSRRHGRKRRNPLTKTQRHKDREAFHGFLSLFSSSCLCVFVRASSFRREPVGCRERERTPTLPLVAKCRKNPMTH